MEEEFLKVQGFKINKSDAKALQKIEKIVGREIPIIPDVGGDQFGAVIWFKRIIGLSLNGCGLNGIPDEIFDIDTLKFLYLNGNHLTEIPKGIQNLRKLESLSVRNNAIKKIPKLPETIRGIDFSRNKLFGEIQFSYLNLTKIILSDNSISSLKFSVIPERIKILDLSRNNLKMLPKSLVSVPFGRISLQGNKLESLDDSFPTNMEELNIAQNNLGPIVDFENFGTFSNLLSLNISLNNVSELLFEVNQFPQLEILRVTGNKLTRLPDKLVQIRTLKKIYAGGNQITELQHEFCTKKELTYLGLEKNKISVLPFWIDEVSAEINLKNNPIKLL